MSVPPAFRTAERVLGLAIYPEGDGEQPPVRRIEEAGMTDIDSADLVGESGACSLEQVIDSYHEYLQRSVGQREAMQYRARRASNFEAAATEAVVFEMLQQDALEPLVYERVGQTKSKPDFVCGQGVNKFYVEATSFREDKVTRGTGLPARDIELDRAYNFELMTREICQRVEEKSGKYHVRNPLVLALGSHHTFSHVAFGDLAVRQALECGVFQLGEHDTVEARHRDISCVLLLQLDETTWRAQGMLHPDPCHTIPANLLPDVPFARITPWPPKGTKLNVGWTSDPRHAPLHTYCPVRTPDSSARPQTGKPEGSS